MPAIAFSTIKGGVGKTTLSVHVAAAHADLGRTVLFLDLDPQAHASLALGLEPTERPCIADALGPRPKHKLSDVVLRSPARENLFIAPAALRMAVQERDLYHWGHRLQAIPRALATLNFEPDLVVIDTPPSIGPFTEAVMHYVDIVCAPVPTGAFALQGLSEIESAWRQIREGNAGQLLVVVNMYDRRTSATNFAMEGALKELTVPVLKTRIPRSEAINQAGLAYELIYDMAKGASGAEELRALALDLGRRLGLPAVKRGKAASAAAGIG